MTATRIRPPAPASTHGIAGAINATKRYGKGDTAVLALDERHRRLRDSTSSRRSWAPPVPASPR